MFQLPADHSTKIDITDWRKWTPNVYNAVLSIISDVMDMDDRAASGVDHELLSELVDRIRHYEDKNFPF